MTAPKPQPDEGKPATREPATKRPAKASEPTPAQVRAVKKRLRS